MAKQVDFGLVDRSQLEDAKRLLAKTTAGFIDNMRLKDAVESDLSNKQYSTSIYNAYVNQLAPKKIKRLDPVTQEQKEVDQYPSDQEVLSVASAAKQKLAESVGFHTDRAIQMIDKDVEQRSKFKRTDPRRAELDYYVETFGLEQGLKRFNETLTGRAVSPVEARTTGQLAIEKERGAQRRATEAAMPFDWGQPQQLKNGNWAIPLFHKPTGQVTLKDTGFAAMPKASQGSSQAKVEASLSNLTAYTDQLDQYEKLLQDVWSGRLGGTAAKGAAMIGLADSARAAGGYQDALASLGARTVNGERGVLTNQDVERAKKLIPLITDTESERALKFQLLRELLEKRKAAVTNGYDGPITTPTLNRDEFAPEYPDISWDVEDSKAFKSQFGYWPSYEDAFTESQSVNPPERAK